MFFFRKFNITSNAHKQELLEIFESELVGVHKTVWDGFFSKSDETYELTNDYGRFLLQKRNDSKPSLITVFSVIKIEDSGNGTSELVVKTTFTPLTRLIIVLVHLILISSILFMPSVKTFQTDISNNSAARVLLLCSYLLLINLVLWWKHRSSSKQQERILTDIMTNHKLL